ncbi:fatty acid--CoA ligase [Amycolatopsis antarctica]|uniref:Fatty acid--CoA ligase n=1 Tax=Amycolatopsis antarctica TaxID=1854586 RepID=A0A263DBG0_9PSEU|nr:fatty acid--CoA ligase [Amycolatopsis antarctica]
MRNALSGRGAATTFGHRGSTITGAEAAALLDRLDGGLGAAGVGPDDVLAIAGGNRPETVLTQIAAQLRGAAVLLLAASAPVPDRIAALDAAAATVLVVDPCREPERVGPLVAAAGERTVLSLGDPPAGTRDLLGLRGTPTATPPPGVRTIFPSGGTTGRPKLIRHSSIYETMAHIFAPEPDGPRLLLVSPMSHMTGNAAVLGTLLRGGTSVLHEDFDAGAVLDAIEAERIGTLSLTPARLVRLLDHPRRPRTDTSSLSELSVGAAPLPAHRLAQALDAFGPVLRQGYGLTEAPMVAGIAAAEFDGHPERLLSVGRIVPGMRARVVGADGTPLPAGVAGEIEVSGLAVMDGYQDEALTAAALRDGWLRTGDLGHFDAEGYLYLLGRSGEVIVTGEHGSKVHPARLEAVLTAHPAIRQAAVFGVPGPDGELVHAVVVPASPGTPRAEDVRAWVRAELGQDHLVPASVEFAGTLPLTAIGKVDKRALRASVSGPAAGHT